MDTLSSVLTIMLMVSVVVVIMTGEILNAEKQPIGTTLLQLALLALFCAAPSLLLFVFPPLRRLGKRNVSARATAIVLFGLLNYVLVWGVAAWILLEFDHSMSCAHPQYGVAICDGQPSLEQLVQRLLHPLSQLLPVEHSGDYLLATALLIVPSLISMTLVSLFTRPEG